MKINILGRTGPRSLKGKSISAMNAVKHRGYAKTEILQFEDASERRRLEKEIYKALNPADAIEESLADGLVNSYWLMERLKLRLSVRQDGIFKLLTPIAVAELIQVPDAYRSYAPEFLKEPNTKICKKRFKAATTALSVISSSASELPRHEKLSNRIRYPQSPI